MQEDRGFWAGSLCREDRISPCQSQGLQSQGLLHAPMPSRNSHRIVQALSAETPPQLHLPEPHTSPGANTAICLVKPFWFPWAPIIFLQMMGPFLKTSLTLYTFMYTWFSPSVIKYLTEATEGGMTYFTQIEGTESSIAEESPLLTVGGGERKTMQFSQLPPF